MAWARYASPLVVPGAGCHVLVLITADGPAPGHRPRHCPAQAAPPNPTAAGPWSVPADGVLSRVGAADHAVTPKAPWTGSGWREHSYGGFGGGHAPSHMHAFWPQPDLHSLHYQLGNLCYRGFRMVDLRCGQSASDRAGPVFTGVNGPLMARPPWPLPGLGRMRMHFPLAGADRSFSGVSGC